MADEIQHFTATIPAGTPKATPVTVTITMPPRIVRSVDWRVPSGPKGVFGWLLAMGGVPVQPQPPGTYIVAHNETGTWNLAGQPDSGTWQVIGYNTGANPHSVYLAFHVDTIKRDTGLAPLIPAWELGPAGDLSQAGPPLPGA